MGHDLFPILATAVIAAAFLFAQTPPFVSFTDSQVGVEELGRRSKDPQVTATGQPGIQPRLLRPGTYFTFRRRVRLAPVVVVPDGCVGVVTAHVGQPTEGLAAYYPDLGDFTDVERFISKGGRQGVQEAVLPPGTYAIHPDAFEVSIVDDGKVTFYGRRTSTSDILSDADAYTVVINDDLLIAIEPESTTLAARMTAGNATGGYRSIIVMTSPVGAVTIEWEVAIRDGSLPCEEQIRSELATLARTEFDSLGRWTVTDFIAKVEALDEAAGAKHYARVTEAVMRPLMVETS